MYLLDAAVMLLALKVFTDVSGYNVFEVEKLCFDNGNAFKQAADDTTKYSCKLYCQCPSSNNFSGVSIPNCELCCCIIGKIHRIKDTELKEKDNLIKTVKNDYENAIKQRNKQIQHMKKLSDNKATSLNACREKLVEKDLQYREYQNHTEVNTRRNKIALSKLQDSLSKKEDECRDYVIATGISGAFNILFITTIVALLFCFCKKRRKTTTYSFTNQQQVPVSQPVGLNNQINVQIDLPEDDQIDQPEDDQIDQPEDDETSNTQSDTEQHQRCQREKMIPEMTSRPEQETSKQPRTRKQENEKKAIPEITSRPEQETSKQPRTRKQEKEKKVISEITSRPEQETLELKEIQSNSNKTSTKKRDITSRNQQKNQNRMKNSSQLKKESLNPLEATSLLNQEEKELREGDSLSNQKKEKFFHTTSHPKQGTCQQLEIQHSSNDEDKAQTYLSENSDKTNLSKNMASIDIIPESNRINNLKSECSNDNRNQEEIISNQDTEEEVNRSRPFSHLVIVSDGRESPPSPEAFIDQLTF